MDVGFVTWGAVIGRVLLALVATGSATAMFALAMRGATPTGRFVRSLLRARRSLDGAEVGDRIVALGRIEIDGPAARRFDDGAPCALASLETDGGFATAHGRTLYLRTRRHRMRLVGPVSIEATTRTARRWRPSGLLRLHLWRERLPTTSPVRVASLAIGELALVVGRAEKDLARERTTYRDAPLVVAIGAGNEPVAVLGLGHLGPALARFALRAAVPTSALCVLASGLAALSLARPDWIDELGGRDASLVPAHLALPLLSPWHREHALRGVDAWLVESLGRRTTQVHPHLLEIADAIAPLVPSCEREAAVALARPGRRSEQPASCDAEVGAAVVATWASPHRSRSAEERAASWADLVTSIERAPEVGERFARQIPVPLIEDDEWERVSLVLRSPRPGLAMQRMAAIHLRRLAISEALAGSRGPASLLERAAQRYGSVGEIATSAALLAIRDDAALGDGPSAPLSLRELRLHEGEYLEAALDAAERVARGERETAYRILAPHTWARRVPLTRSLVLAALEERETDAHLADVD